MIGGAVAVSVPGQLLDWAAVGRAFAGEELSGDGWGAFGPPECTTFALVDGAGHGPLAHRAATRALEAVQRTASADAREPLQRVMRACHVALSGTRGAAVALLRLDLDRRTASFCGVGNIVLHAAPPRHNCGVSLPGTVGFQLRSVRVFETELRSGDAWWLCTDGISSRMTLGGLWDAPPIVSARRLLEDFGGKDDDATVLAVRLGALGPRALAAPARSPSRS